MNDLRVESEDMFLNFVPKSSRSKIRSCWYKKSPPKNFLDEINPFTDPKLTRDFFHPFLDLKSNPKITFKTKNHKEELINNILDYLNIDNIKIDPINSGQFIKDKNIDIIITEKNIISNLKKVVNTSTPYKFVTYFPELSYLRIIGENKNFIYSIIRNKAHYNVSFVFDEEKARIPEKDTFNIIKDYIGSYPNLFLVIKLKDLSAFLTTLLKIDSKSKFYLFVDKYGVRRTDSNFWYVSDWFTDDFINKSPIRGGLFDLNRYSNIPWK